MRRALAALVLLAACPAKQAEPVADELVEVCRGYQATLNACGSGLPPGFPDQAIVPPTDLPVRAGSRAIPKADQPRVARPVDLRDATPALPAPGAAVYAAGPSSTPVAAVIALRDHLPAGAEIRLLVARTDEEIVAMHAAMFPRTPPALRARLPALVSVTVAAPELVAMSGSCRAVRDAFIPLSNGAPINSLGPGTAAGLAACRCQLADLDGYVGLLTWLLRPFPRTGYLAVDGAVLAGLAGEATVGDLIAALP